VNSAVKNFAPGDLVIVPFQISCSDCERCRRRHTNACTSAPFRSAEGLKPVCGVAYWLRQWPGAEVLIIGGGGRSIGMFAVQAGSSRGARRVVYLDDNPQRLAKAKSLGAEVHETPKGLVMEAVGLFPIVVDAAATDASILLAFRSAEPNGICQRIYRDFAETTPVPPRHRYGVAITLPTGRVNARAEMLDCVAHVASGDFRPEHSITRRVRFEDAGQAIGDPTIPVALVRDGIE